MSKILVYTNLIGSMNVPNVENYLRLSGFDIDFDNIYYNHAVNDHSIYDRIYALIDTSCKMVSEELINDIKTRCAVLSKKKIKLVLCNFWESKNQIKTSKYSNILCDTELDVWDGGRSFFWFLIFQRYNNSTFKFYHTNKKFDFLYLNKSQRRHRDLLFDKLNTYGILEKSLFSYHSRGLCLRKDYEIPEYVNGYPKYGADRDVYEKPYNESVFNIVSETSESEIFLTEKIFKPILAKQPFIVHGAPRYLKTLKEMGFKTFDSFIDESYDEVEQLLSRTDKIASLCLSLQNINHLEFYYKTKEVREHNLKTLFCEDRLRSVITQDVTKLFKLADGCEISS